MTAPTDQEISEAIEAAYEAKSGFNGRPSSKVDDAVSDWWGNFSSGDDALWERWPCDGESCPALPAYDAAIDSLFGELDGIREEVRTLIAARLMGMAKRIRDEYPDAPRVSTKPELSADA